MSLYCDDGFMASMPPHEPPPSKPERGAPWKPPVVVACERCGRASWQHRSFPPVLADEIDRAIYAAAFVAYVMASGQPLTVAGAEAVREAEKMVALHGRVRSGA